MRMILTVLAGIGCNVILWLFVSHPTVELQVAAIVSLAVLAILSLFAIAGGHGRVATLIRISLVIAVLVPMHFTASMARRERFAKLSRQVDGRCISNLIDMATTHVRVLNPNEITDVCGNVARAITLYKRDDASGSVVIEFVVGSGWPVRASGYVYVSDGVVAGDPFLENRWGTMKRLKERWYSF